MHILHLTGLRAIRIGTHREKKIKMQHCSPVIFFHYKLNYGWVRDSTMISEHYKPHFCHKHYYFNFISTSTLRYFSACYRLFKQVHRPEQGLQRLFLDKCH